MDIAPGSLYRLEGWALEEGDFDLSSYRDRDQNWKKIAFEGMFLDPSDNPSANQTFNLTNYVAAIVHNAHANNNTEQGRYYILFLTPQDCDAIDPAKDFPIQFDSYSAYPESDFKRGTTRVFVCRNNKAMDLGRFKTLDLIGQTWDEAVESNKNLFLPLNPLLRFCDSESENDLGTSDSTPTDVISFVNSVGRCIVSPAADRPEWFDALEQAAGAGVMKCAEQAGFSGIDILDLLYFVQESNEPAPRLILSRLNTPIIPEKRAPSGLDTTQARAFFKLLIAEGSHSEPYPEWFNDACKSETAESLVCAARKAGFNMTIEEFDEVVRAAEGEEEQSTADWIFMKNILG